MSLRGRLTLMSALIVGAILAAASVICFVVIRAELRGQVDEQLRSQQRLIRNAPFEQLRSRRLPAPPRQTGGGAPFGRVTGHAAPLGSEAVMYREVGGANEMLPRSTR